MLSNFRVKLLRLIYLVIKPNENDKKKFQKFKIQGCFSCFILWLHETFSIIDYSQADDDYPIVGTSLAIVPVSNGRENFITGHRIPLELFPKETLRRIELIADELVAPSEQTTPATTTSSTTTPKSKISPDNSYVESRSFRLEPSLTAETDSQFESTVDKFVPDY
jgi:hypothetical protein